MTGGLSRKDKKTESKYRRGSKRDEAWIEMQEGRRRNDGRERNDWKRGRNDGRGGEMRKGLSRNEMRRGSK